KSKSPPLKKGDLGGFLKSSPSDPLLEGEGKVGNKKPLNRGALKSIQSLKLKIGNFHNFVFHFTLRRYDFYFIAFAFAQKTASNRRVHRDFVDLKVCFIIAYNLIGLLFFGVQVFNRYCYAENHTTVLFKCFNINNLHCTEFTFDVLNTTFTETLLLASSMVFRVFFQIPM